MDRYSKSGYCFPTITYFKDIITQQQKLISEKHQQEVKCVAGSEIVPNWRFFISVCGQEIKEKVENKVPW